ncbi:MAG: hypothetical protein K2J39_08795, partial [Ruminococcus sp.]|nr:hypothetical protein [Ruminococcus sp.]
YIMFGNNEENSVYDEIFGKGFNNYIRLISNSRSLREKRQLQQTILEALYLEETGISYKNVSSIPLTLRRNDNIYQKVFIISGKIKKDDLKIEITDLANRFEDNDNKKEINLIICGKEKFRITLPLIIYFERLAEGAISTSANPALTHGISTLKTLLHKCAKNNTESSTIEVMLNKTDEAKYYNLDFDDDDKTLFFS